MFHVYEVPSGAAQTTETLGTKYKFWYRDKDFGLTLFKEGRPGTGENWSERIASELAHQLNMPHATYELATYEGCQGVVSRSLVDRNARIIHGNELLASLTTDYGKHGGRYRNPNHTLRRVLAYLRKSAEVLGSPYGWNHSRSDRIHTPLDFFIGYLMFDAWIGNQDRHDENWGVLRANEGNLYLAPSYDHGSSMARNEPDDRRLARLSTNDKPFHITAFVKTARSAFFPSGSAADTAPFYTLEAFTQAAAQSPGAAAEWRERLATIDIPMVSGVINQVPADWMTEPARAFTTELLRLNRERILNADPL